MTRFAFFEGEIRPIEDARISVRTHAFNYGTGWFGGRRGYWNEEQQQLYVFRIYDHYQRFLQSGSLLYAALPCGLKLVALALISFLSIDED